MRYAITSTGDSPASTLDNRFGHCAYFVIFDSEIGSTEYIPNPYKNSEENAGILAAKLIAQRNVSKAISGEFGIKVKPVLDNLKIQMIIMSTPGTKVSDIINMLNGRKKN